MLSLSKEVFIVSNSDLVSVFSNNELDELMCNQQKRKQMCIINNVPCYECAINKKTKEQYVQGDR